MDSLVITNNYIKIKNCYPYNTILFLLCIITKSEAYNTMLPKITCYQKEIKKAFGFVITARIVLFLLATLRL
jgi:hypothetical protein